MTSSKFAFRAFMMLGLASIIVVVVFLAYIGVLGVTAQNILRLVWEPIEDFYKRNQPASDVALTALGVVGSAASATFAMMKAWHYAEINLPARVEDYVSDRIEKFDGLRPQLVAAMRSHPQPDAFLETSSKTRRFQSALAAVGLADDYTHAKLLADSSEQVSSHLAIVEARRTELLNEKAAVHLLRGLHFAAMAQRSEQGSRQRREANETALAELKLALSAKSEDIEALEAAASVSLELGQEPTALMYLENMKVIAQAKRKPCAQARALRLKAAILERKPTRPSWNEARASLEAAIDVLSQDQGSGQDYDPKSELAEALILLAEVQIKREKFSAARQALQSASVAVSRLALPSEHGIQDRLLAATRHYDVASKDPERPREDDL